MIQLHYLGGSSEITPFGNETVRTRSSEAAVTGPSPRDSDIQPWDTRGRCSPPSAPGLAVDGESHVPDSLRSAPKLEGCRISACLFVLSSGTKHGWFASNAFYFRTAPSLLATTWSSPDHGSWELAGIARRSMQTELLSMSLQDTAGPGVTAGLCRLSLYIAFAFLNSGVHRGSYCLVGKN